MTIEHVRAGKWRKRERGSARALATAGEGAVLSEEVREAYPPHPGRRMSEVEFLGWVKERTRAEWVNGEVIIMSPVSFTHDHLQTFLIRLISEFVEDRDLGEVCSSEFFVRLPSAPSNRLADVFFVAKSREGQFSETTYEGAPDLVVEVVSPDSAGRDYREKFMEYQEDGVREYWIVDPLAKKVEAHELVKGKYRKIPERDGAVHSKVLKGLFIKPAWLWQKRLPKVSAVWREMGQK